MLNMVNVYVHLYLNYKTIAGPFSELIAIIIIILHYVSFTASYYYSYYSYYYYYIRLQYTWIHESL